MANPEFVEKALEAAPYIVGIALGVLALIKLAESLVKQGMRPLFDRFHPKQ